MGLRSRSKLIESNPAQHNCQFVSAEPTLSSPPNVKSLKEEWQEAFDDFWRDYPRKVGKPMALKGFMRIKPWSQESCDQIFAGLDRWNAYWQEAETDKSFIPYPATWLNQQRWEDDPNA